MIRLGMISMLIAFMAVAVTHSALPETEDDDSSKQQREEQLAAMRRRAESTTVKPLSKDRKTAAKLVTQPIFRYSDQPRTIMDATLWAWGVKGRPIAVCKIERYRRVNRRWLYCMASLSTELIESEWPDGHRWSSKKPGLQLFDLPSGPKPAKSDAGRLRQIRSISRRFASTLIDPIAKTRQEMRLLPRPLCRYSNHDSGLVDGAIFGFSTNGTNPDGLFVIELHQPGKDSNQWKYGVAGMTQGGLSVRLDGKEVWTKEYTRGIGPQPTWIWFFEQTTELTN